MDCQDFLHGGQGIKLSTKFAFFGGDDGTDLDTAGIVVMSKRSFDVCFVISFLNEVGDGRFDSCVVLFFVRELKILYKNVRERQRNCERKRT